MVEGTQVSGSGMTWQTVALGLALIVVINAALFFLYRYSIRNLLPGAGPRQQKDNPHLHAVLRHEIDELKDRVSALSAEVQQLKALKPAISPYNQALHMAKQGYAVVDVASSCGISRGEAELIIALYRKSKIKGVE